MLAETDVVSQVCVRADQCCPIRALTANRHTEANIILLIETQKRVLRARSFGANLILNQFMSTKMEPSSIRSRVH